MALASTHSWDHRHGFSPVIALMLTRAISERMKAVLSGLITFMVAMRAKKNNCKLSPASTHHDK
jgi:hypothetical protein